MPARKDAALAEYEAFELVVQGIIAEPRATWAAWTGVWSVRVSTAWVGRYRAGSESASWPGEWPELVLWSGSAGMRCLVVEQHHRGAAAFGVGWAHRRRDGTWLLDEERRASSEWHADPEHRTWEVGERRPERWVLEPRAESFRVVSRADQPVQPFLWRRMPELLPELVERDS